MQLVKFAALVFLSGDGRYAVRLVTSCVARCSRDQYRQFESNSKISSAGLLNVFVRITDLRLGMTPSVPTLTLGSLSGPDASARNPSILIVCVLDSRSFDDLRPGIKRSIQNTRAFSGELDAGSSQKMRPNKKLERRSDSIGSKCTLVKSCRAAASREMCLDLSVASRRTH